MTASRFRSSELTRAIRAAKAAGVDNFDVVIGEDGLPVIRIRGAAANDAGHDVDAEIEAWARGQDDAA